MEYPVWLEMRVSPVAPQEATTIPIFPFMTKRFLQWDPSLLSTVPWLWPSEATLPGVSLPHDSSCGLMTVLSAKRV